MKKAKLILEAEYNDIADAYHISDALHLIASKSAVNGMLTFDGMLKLRTWDAEVFVHETIDLDDFPNIKSEHLDFLVHEMKSEEAASINNAGIEEQLDYIIDSMGRDEVLKYLKGEK